MHTTDLRRPEFLSWCRRSKKLRHAFFVIAVITNSCYKQTYWYKIVKLKKSALGGGMITFREAVEWVIALVRVTAKE